MNTLTTRDIARLSTLDARLRSVVYFVADTSNRDLWSSFMVIETCRSRAAQQIAYDTGHSKARPGQSAHDFVPSLAVDLAPLPLDWANENAFHSLARSMKIAATRLGIGITWGGDWHSIEDMPHFELSNWKSIIVANYNSDGNLKNALPQGVIAGVDSNGNSNSSKPIV